MVRKYIRLDERQLRRLHPTHIEFILTMAEQEVAEVESRDTTARDRSWARRRRAKIRRLRQTLLAGA